MNSTSKTPSVVLGTMTFGKQVDEAGADRMLGAFLDAGYREIDTAYAYCDGATEEILGRILSPEKREKARIATKANPWSEAGLRPARVIEQLDTSLKRMKLEFVDILYLHAPDPDTPIERTLSACEKLFQDGKFRELGLSNYAAWQVAEIQCLSASAGFPKPVVYEGMYNAITRDVERELFPALRNFSMRFNSYNALAGGLLTGKHRKYGEMPDSGRFAGNRMYQERYWKKRYFDALEKVRSACEEAGISPAEAAHRWLFHHSMMAGGFGDAVIIGASRFEHFEANLAACRAGLLPDTVVKSYNEAWETAKPECPKYFRP